MPELVAGTGITITLGGSNLTVAADQAAIRAMFSASGLLGYSSGAFSLSAATVQGQFSASGLLGYASGTFSLSATTVRSQFSASGVLSYDSGTGAFTLAAATVRAQISAGAAPIAYDNTTGVITFIISGLTAASGETGTDELYLRQSGGHRRWTLTALLAWMRAQLRTIDAKTADYTVVQGDHGKRLTMSNASARTFTLADLSVGTVIELQTIGAGDVTFAVSGGLTLRQSDGHTKLAKQWAVVVATKISATEWSVEGATKA